MYNFRDVNEASEVYVLPSEALKINGKYIENIIPGYRTLSVQGREALSPDVVSFTTGVRDGSRLKSKRYPERIIVVNYQLIANSNEEFREAYNQLAEILNVEDAELIFNDEQDKFFLGTPCIIGSVDPGRNAVVGKFEILCTDPFKYSVIEYEAEPYMNNEEILIDYGGTYKAFPILEADFYNEEEASENGEVVSELSGDGDCGYVAFFNENKKIIQIGDPDEVDEESGYPKSQTLVNAAFKKSTSWGTAAKSQWSVNSGITSSSSVEQVGTVAMGVASVAEKETSPTTSGTLLNATSTANKPTFYYKVTAKTSNRTANSVKVSIAITASLGNDASYFGYSLATSVYIGGSWHNVTMKESGSMWRGKSGHTKNLTVTVTGLTEAQYKLTGIKFKAYRNDNFGTAGTLAETACSDLKVSPYSADTAGTHYLTASNYGTGAKWHGPSITRTIPADKAGDVGAKNFTLTYSQKMSIGSGSNSTKQLGAFQVLLVSGTGSSRKIVAGVNVYKGSSGKKAKLRFYVNGSVAQTTEIDLSHNSKYFHSGKSSSIKKSGQTITFNICGIKKVFRDSEIKNTLVNSVTFTFTKYGSKTPLSYNGLFWAKFVKDNCDTMKDIPNKFSTGDVVEANCRNGEIYLNGVLDHSLGALGNDWEDFYLTPGINQIGFSYSEWVTDEYAPKMKVRYREVFL